MFYLRYKDGSMIATTSYPINNRENYTEITAEEYNAFIEQLEKEAEEEANTEDYLAALEELGVSE